MFLHVPSIFCCSGTKRTSRLFCLACWPCFTFAKWLVYSKWLRIPARYFSRNYSFLSQFGLTASDFMEFGQDIGDSTWTASLQPRHIPTQGYNITQSSAPNDGHMVARNMLSNYYKRNKEYKKWHLVGFSYPHWITMHGQPHIRFTNKVIKKTLNLQKLYKIQI